MTGVNQRTLMCIGSPCVAQHHCRILFVACDTCRAWQARGVVLSSNQVQYNLLYRTPERNGVLEACQELGITCVFMAACALCVYTPTHCTGSWPTARCVRAC